MSEEQKKSVFKADKLSIVDFKIIKGEIDADFEFRYFADYLSNELQNSQQTIDDTNLTVRLIISRLFSV